MLRRLIALLVALAGSLVIVFVTDKKTLPRVEKLFQLSPGFL